MSEEGAPSARKVGLLWHDMSTYTHVIHVLPKTLSWQLTFSPPRKRCFFQDTGIGGSTSGQWTCTARRSSWISLLSTESPAVAAMEPIAAAIAAWVVASALMTDLFLRGEFYCCLVASTLWSYFFLKNHWKNRTGSQRLLDFHGVLSIQKLQVSQSLQCKSRKFQGRDLAESKSFPNKDILGDGVTYF